MFSTAGLFNKIKCPEVALCLLPSCLFSHTISPAPNVIEVSSLPTTSASTLKTDSEDPKSRPKKRRRIENDDGQLVKSSKVVRYDASITSSTGGPTDGSISKSIARECLPKSSTRAISPPPLRKESRPAETGRALNGSSTTHHYEVDLVKSRPTRKDRARESLNPRMLKKPPASHVIRLKLLGLLHEQMLRLNKEIQKSTDPAQDALELSEAELITAALDEEFKTARDDAKVYTNVLKLRIVALKRMNLDGWKKERLKQIAQDFPQIIPPEVKKPVTSLETGLSSIEELLLVPKLITAQDSLSKHGYVTSPPTEAEVEQARKGVDTSQGWEQCDRCKSRFQVFPGRRAEDGALTSGGSCTYHFGKPRRPAKEKSDTGHKETVYLCCGQQLGTPGCVTVESHVFKVSENKRLALIMPFKRTTNPGPITPESAVCFDCEMGYTTLGMELIRLTATAWPDGTELLDVLVRPLGEVLDLNSRFSGVWPQHFTDAVQYTGGGPPLESGNDTGEQERRLSLVNSPSEARELLFAHLTTTTPLIGHALENDLNSVRIIHPTIIDTVMLYPHPRGLPIRYGLKMLVKKHLNRDIQMGGAQGHDSKEDARAAGELVRLKVKETWKAMQADGWTVSRGEFSPPLPGGPPPTQGVRVLEAGGVTPKRLYP
ncbi:RNA exonuclease 3 [Xylographa carneopallida]|nr:RNA exonuclease 3 [Xylographa carneopallida]